MAMILDAFLSKFSELIMQMVQDEVGMLLGIPGQMEKLNNTVRDIQCVLADAERKQSNSKAVERWLKQLKDVMYDADDVIDLCKIKATERLAGSSSYSASNARCGIPLLSCFRNPFFAHEIGSQIKDINLRLEGIVKRKHDLGLAESPIFVGPSSRVCRVDTIISRKTDPSVVLDDIVGEKIEGDTELLVNWLIEEEKGVREKICVAAIVGMGGIGKTTLAKRIFNDQRIHEEFQLKVWVCVSKEVKGIEILKCMIREAGGEHGAATERSELVPLLKGLVKGKKFLLVLDDVWEESRTIWDDLLRDPMTDGAHGSRLLVTTRDGRVANRMKAAKSHQVNKLSDEDGWSLLVKQVAPNRVESEIKDLMEIGMQIVKKCDGLPIAIKSIGGVLCTKGNTRDNWEAILESHVWFMNGLLEDVHRAFYLSYEDLPSHLKQCFIFCSLYPEDFLFYKTDLICMWQAEGFFEGKGNFWELGQLYYTELIVRNILEDHTISFFRSERCKMHDLLWSFARQLGKDENCVLREKQVLTKSDDSVKVRRLSLEGNDVVNAEVIKNEKGVRTLVLHNKSDVALDDLCKAASKLRILDLSMSNISSLPDSLFSLVHLRYLDVSNSKLRNISSSLGNLRNLEIFNCTGCTELSHIPQSISNLRELRFLCFANTKVEALPMGLNNIEKLSLLYGFRPYKNSSEGFSSLDGLESLSQLIELSLWGLESVSDRNIAKRANLITKNKLRVLSLHHTYLSPDEQLSQTNERKMATEDVLNELCPPRSVDDITIFGYFGRYLPNWLNLEATLPNLKYLTIDGCGCFEGLAPLGQLPNLDFLQIIGAYSVVSVGEEFFWGDVQSRETVATSCLAKPAFPKLSKLLFSDMPNWKEWQWNKGQPAMPKLTEFTIEGCPQLRSLPEGLSYYATSLECVIIDGADNLIALENLPTTKEIFISDSPNLVRISNIPNILFIKIMGCPNLRTLENLKSLQRMKLVDFEMKALPEYLMTIMPQKLTIKCSEELFREIATQGDTGSEWHKFNHIDKVKLSTLDESLYSTYQKKPFNFTTNIDCLMAIMPQKLAIKCSEELFREIATLGDTGSEWHKFKHIDKGKLSPPI